VLMRTRSSMRRGRSLNMHLMSLVSMVYPRCLRSPPGRTDLGRIFRELWVLDV
jgi:hypothetical protein